jgi:hypothetical protein
VNSSSASFAFSSDEARSTFAPCTCPTAHDGLSHGSHGAASIGPDGNEPTNSGKDIYALIKWDLSVVPAGSKVSSVSVTLNVTNASTETYRAYGLKRAWVESAATCLRYAVKSPWEVAGAKDSLDRAAQVAGSVSLPNTGRQTFPLSPAVAQSWLDNPASNQGIVIAHTTNADGLAFSSRESATSSLGPQLNMTYIAP